MGVCHFVPEGKVLVIPIGGYRFMGPIEVKLSGSVVLPETYEDGSLLGDSEIEEASGFVLLPVGDSFETPMEGPIGNIDAEGVSGSDYLV